jgi:hypothetical protein
MAAKRRSGKAKPVKDLKPRKTSAAAVKGGVAPPGFDNRRIKAVVQKISGMNTN